MSNLETQSPTARELIRWFDNHHQVAVAFSGGVDSSVVLAAALRSKAAQRSGVIAVTAKSPSVAPWQIELAQSVARQLKAEHRIVETDEMEKPEYVVNDSNRCFHCKTTLYEKINDFMGKVAGASSTVVSGTNADDLGDYRPGIEAGRLSGVSTPLADLGIGKDAVRAIAHEWGLENADLPASPCLSSRLAYGVQVTVERLSMVDQAEAFLREMGLHDMRVRLHEGELARIEVPSDKISFLVDDERRQRICVTLKSLGFRYIAIDLEGFSSGSMNRQLVSLGVQA